MDENKTYNGWANYETWNVALWLGNDSGVSDYWREQAEEAYRDAEAGEYEWQDRKSEAAGDLADRLKDAFDENLPNISGTYADLLMAALGCVDWREIAEHYVEDVAPEIDAEEAQEAKEEEEEASAD